MYILLNVWLHYEQVIADNHLAAMAIGEIALKDTFKIRDCLLFLCKSSHSKKMETSETDSMS